jgi:hypothetical protein
MKKVIIILHGQKEQKNKFGLFLEENYKDAFWHVNPKNLLRLIVKKFFFHKNAEDVFFIFEKFFYYRGEKDARVYCLQRAFACLLEKYESGNSVEAFDVALKDLTSFAEKEFDFPYAHVASVIDDFRENEKTNILVVHGCNDERLKDYDGAYSVYLAATENAAIRNMAQHDVVVINFETLKETFEILLKDKEMK